MPTKQLSRRARSLRAVLDDPALPALIQALPARELARLCERIGPADAMQIMVLAPAERLVQALDASVWKSPRPGVCEVFDARELVEWIFAWLEIGETFTAERLAVVPDDSVLLYLSQLATVTTASMWGFERSTEIEDLDRIFAPSHDEMAYGPYVVCARQQEDWDVLRGSLDAMWSDAPQRLLHLFAQLAGDESMLAPSGNRESGNEDLVAARELAHERQGFVTVNGARAFLALAKGSLEELASLSAYDLETARYLAVLAETAAEAQPPVSDFEQVAILQTVLEEVGLLEPPPERLLLAHEATSSPLPVVALLQSLETRNPTQFDARARELAYLTSVLIAGIAVDGAALGPIAARDAVLATCNLGLEILQSRGARVRIDGEPGLVQMFLVGFCLSSTLPDKVVECFVERLKALRTTPTDALHEWLVEQAEGSVADLHEAVIRADFVAAREAVMALCFVFEPHACQAAVPLLDELPRLAAADNRAATWIDSLSAMANVAQVLRSITAKPHRRP